ATLPSSFEVRWDQLCPSAAGGPRHVTTASWELVRSGCSAAGGERRVNVTACTTHGMRAVTFTLFGIMWVIEDHRALRAHIMPDHVGDRGAVRPILEPHDRLHINHVSQRRAGTGRRSGSLATPGGSIARWGRRRSSQ